MQELEIIKATEKLLQDFYNIQDIGEIEPPINPVAIAKAVGLKVYSSQLDDHVDGIYDKNKKVIYVSQASSRNRQMFTVAHELGHYCLHKDKDFDVFYRRDLDTLGQPKFTEDKRGQQFCRSPFDARTTYD